MITEGQFRIVDEASLMQTCYNNNINACVLFGPEEYQYCFVSPPLPCPSPLGNFRLVVLQPLSWIPGKFVASTVSL